MTTDLSSTNNTVNFQNSACRVLFAQMAFTCKFYVGFARAFVTLGFQKALDVCSISIYKAENVMTHPFLKVKIACPTPLGRLKT